MTTDLFLSLSRSRLWSSIVHAPDEEGEKSVRRSESSRQVSALSGHRLGRLRLTIEELSGCWHHTHQFITHIRLGSEFWELSWVDSG
ncbi:hypothetical protein RchiOBHm_Chr7g0201831 [Rosa chinensis]|uniref:Uncharacterized protein n=1 Tax=Rosa chinensis TaxID=74649 RepID=A0A2P6P807_ROSCH|nr:hypothetical protein RchiOBHm_Chr7g0201831 [Rosa chinensis]